MGKVTLNADTLNKLKALATDPSQAVRDALKALAPDGKWELLTQKIGANLAKPDLAEITLPLLDKSFTQGGTFSSAWAWSASVDTNAALSIDLLTGQDLAHLPIKPADGHTMVVYGAKISAGGKLGVSASGLPWGGAGINAAGERAAAMQWYVQADSNDRLLAALETAQPHFCWPHDLQGMMHEARGGDWYGMEYTLDGTAQLGIEIDASKALTGWTFSLAGEGSGVGLSFGVKAGLKAARKSNWKLSAMKETRILPNGDQVPGLRVKLHDLQQNSRKASLDLGAGADFSVAVASAERALQAAWPDIGKDALLGELTMPGTAIASRLHALIAANLDGPLAELAAVLTGGTPSEEFRAKAIDHLTFGLGDALDRALGGIATQTDVVKQAAATWIARIAGDGSIAPKVGDEINGLVAEALGMALEGLDGAIGKLKDRIANKAQAEVDAVLKPLGELGAQFTAVLDKVDANTASAEIRAALKKYSELRAGLLQALADSQRLKLALELSAALTRDSAAEAAFDAWFRADAVVAPEAERLFHMLCGGKLLALPELVRQAVATGAITGAKGWLLSTASTLSEQRVVLNFFGVEISNTATWLKDVSIKTDLVTGDLLAVAKGGVETAISNPWKNRTARLGVQLDMSAGGADAPRLLATSLDGAFTARQENTNRGKVQDLLNAYADATGVQRSDIGRFLDVPPASDGDSARRFWRELTIAVPVALDQRQWATFAGLDAGTIDQVALEFGLSMFRRRYLPDSAFSKDPIADLRDAAENAGELTVLAFLKRFPAHYLDHQRAAGIAGTLKMDVNSSDPFDRGTRQFLAYHRLSATVQAPLRLRDLVAEASARLQALAAPVDPHAVSRLLDPTMSRIQQALAPVAMVSETWLGIGLGGAKDEPVAWPFVSFITTMAKLAALDVPPGFVPVAQSGDQPAVHLIAAG